VNYSTAGAIDRESRARVRLMNSHADGADNRVRVMNRTEDTEVVGRNISNISEGIGSIGDAARRIGVGAGALRWGFRQGSTDSLRCAPGKRNESASPWRC